MTYCVSMSNHDMEVDQALRSLYHKAWADGNLTGFILGSLAGATLTATVFGVMFR